MSSERRVWLVIGSDQSVRGFPYCTERWAHEAALEANSDWPEGAPHVVQPFEAIGPAVAPVRK